MPGAEEQSGMMRRPTESERRRMYRDLALALRCGLRDAAAGFSFLRLRGLRALLRTLRSADADLGLFRDSQAIRDLQVVPVLFEHSLRKATGDAVVLTVAQVLGMEPAAARLTNPATDSEVVLALRVLQGCCLLCPGCAAAAHRHNAVKVGTFSVHGVLAFQLGSRTDASTARRSTVQLSINHEKVGPAHQVVLNILMTRGILEQRACLDTLLALLVDCSENQMDFKEQCGLNKIADIIQDPNRDDHVRLKCSEFLLLYSGNAKENCGAALKSNIQEDLTNLFGEKCASFICSMNLFSSTQDSQVRHSELSFLAERVLDYMQPC